jgi:hypothetical protein
VQWDKLSYSCHPSVGLIAGRLFRRFGFSLPPGVVGLLSPPFADFLDATTGTSIWIGGGGETAEVRSFGELEVCRSGAGLALAGPEVSLTLNDLKLPGSPTRGASSMYSLP